MTKEAPENLSVLICTAHRPIFLKDLLESIDAALSENTPFNVEIVIVDNDIHGSALPIVTLIKSLTSLAITYIKEDEPNISVARTAAVKHAKHSLCLFLDDDHSLIKTFSTIYLKQL